MSTNHNMFNDDDNHTPVAISGPSSACSYSSIAGFGFHYSRFLVFTLAGFGFTIAAMKRTTTPPLPVKSKKTAPPQDPERLTDMRRGSYVSQTALANTLADVRERGMPSASSRQSQQRARKTVCEKETPYGPCVVDIDLPLMDKPFTIGIIDPFAMLWRLFSECERFRTLIKDALRASPCSPSSPWHMIIYFDGVSPNNPLDKGDRKSVV